MPMQTQMCSYCCCSSSVCNVYTAAVCMPLILFVACLCCSVYHYSMANYVTILKKGMDMTPGGKRQEAVPEAERLGEEVDLERRVQLLVDTTCLVLFNYVAQVGGSASQCKAQQSANHSQHHV